MPPSSKPPAPTPGPGLRQRVTRLLWRGETQRERAELERLDRTAQALEEADATGETERARLRQEASWQTRSSRSWRTWRTPSSIRSRPSFRRWWRSSRNSRPARAWSATPSTAPPLCRSATTTSRRTASTSRATCPLPQVRVVLQVSNSIPVYDLPDGSQDLGDHFVSVEAVNTGGQPIAITSWGIELPGDRRMFVTRGENWATPLPHVLAPGAPPARFLIRADELQRVEQNRASRTRRCGPTWGWPTERSSTPTAACR